MTLKKRLGGFSPTATGRDSFSKKRKENKEREGIHEIEPTNERKASKSKDKKDPEGVENKFDEFFTTRKFIFLFGIILGIVCAGYFGSKTVMEADFFSDADDAKSIFNSPYWQDWKEMLPTGLKSVLDETENDQYPDTSASFAIGELVKRKGFGSKHNVVIIPGTTSTGIESWGIDSIDGCPGKSYFRKRLWGSFFMVKTMVLDKTCWLKYIKLDPKTGLDPPGVKLRAAQGFEASDFFITGYWIWNKILQNLGAIGYGPDNMITASYDWRLAYLDLEIRDGYFSRLKSSIETMNKLNGNKTVLFGHSMGAQVIFYFLKWVEASGQNFGNGGKHWVNDNIEAFVDISGCLLGTPKAIVALLSGEFKETIELRGLAMRALETFFSRGERVDMLRSWGGILSMLPIGGDMIWGNLSSAPDDVLLPEGISVNGSLGNFIRFANPKGQYSQKNLTVDGAVDFLLDQGTTDFRRRYKENYSRGHSKNAAEMKKNEKISSKWINPLEVPLPNAPDMKVFCFYGVGNPTERAYYYKEEPDKNISNLNVSADMERDQSVLVGEGDGTVSIMTHYMCHKWAQGKSMYNPGGSNVTIVEIKHEPERFDIRGGAKTAEHVDILGSSALNELLLQVASGHGDEIPSNYITHLREMVESIDPTQE